MVLGYLASSWSSLRSGRKTTNSLSQQSQDENSSQPEARRASPADLDEDTPSARHFMNGDKQASDNGGPPTSSMTPQSKKSRKNRQKKRKRRISIEASVLEQESEDGDVVSIPYRADEQAERDALVAQDESMSTRDVDSNVTGGQRAQNASTDGVAKPTRSPVLHQVDGGTRNRYPCPEASRFSCSETFNMLSAARRHLESAHQSGHLSCADCGKTYSHMDTLRRHQRTHAAQVSNASGPNHSIKNSVDESALAQVSSPSAEPEPDKARFTLVTAPNEGFSSAYMDIDNGDSTDQSQKLELTSHHHSIESSVQADVLDNSKAAMGLKRKRRSVDGQKKHQPNKKRKPDLLSPPTSDISKTPETDRLPFAARSKTRNSSSKLNSGKLDGFVKPLLPSSQLHHPTRNPRSSRGSSVDEPVLVPESSHASSIRRNLAKTVNDAAQETPLAGKNSKSSVYSSVKGKQRAEPGVEYTSPVKKRARQGGNEESDSGSREKKKQSQNGIATSVAKRSSSARVSTSPAQSDDDSDSEMDASEHENIAAGADDTISGDVYLCQECHRTFPSLNSLRKHEKRSGVHKLVAQCEDCDQTYSSRKLLRQHQQDRGHGDGTGYSGRKGPFSAMEINKLLRWRNKFCEEYDINSVEFNNMMTDSLRRHKGFIWPYKFINKTDFLQEYYDVLPGRNRRSMHRYRERAFQNTVSNIEWTKEDDRELAGLVKEIGPKWVEIGQRMSRTSDAVNQRWRHKLQYRGKQNDGEWLKDETEQLINAVNQVKRESGMSLDPHAEVRMPWDSVSKKLKGKRTAQQCSNKWRLLYTLRKNGVFMKSDDAGSPGSNSSTPLSANTPSKMSQRLAGTTSSNSRNRPRSRASRISSEYVHESDDEESIGDDGPAHVSDEDQDAAKDTEAGEISKDAETSNQGSDSASQSDDNDPHDTKVEQVQAYENQVHGAASIVPDYDSDQEAQDPKINEASDHELGSTGISPVRDVNTTSHNESSSSGLEDAESVDSTPSSEQEPQLQVAPSASGQSTSDQSVSDLPQNPFYARTPGNQASLSQAFNQTQANTSAVRAPRSGAGSSTRPDRPSPQVPIRARPSSTPVQQEIYHGSQVNDHDASTDDSSSDSSSDESDEDDMVQDTRKESFLQSLRLAAQQHTNNGELRSSQPTKKVNWAKTLQGQTEASEDSDTTSSDDD